LWPSLAKVLEVLIHPPPLLGVTRFLHSIISFFQLVTNHPLKKRVHPSLPHKVPPSLEHVVQNHVV
jgi:hypothetical protein